LVYAPVAWTAAPAIVGEISVRGSAKVNGIGTTSGANVFPGDHIATEANSTASVTSRDGARLLVIESSSAQIRDGGGRLTAVLLSGGVAAVSPAKSPLIVEVRGLRILPATTGSVYAVLLNGNSLKVLARNGAVDVVAENRTVTVEEGKTLDATVGPAPASGNGTGTGSGAGAGGGGGTLTAVLIATTAALAASTIALGVLDATAGCTVSPSGVGTCQVTH
jgi:hypothetical protein